MTIEHLIVDGSNLLYAMRQRRGAGRDKEADRWTVARALDGIVGGVSRRVTVVFDGRREGGRDEAFSAAGFDVLYSRGDMTADTVIEREVLASGRPAAITVVTSDRAERRTVEAAGASSISCEDFLDMMEDARRRMSGSAASSRRSGPRPSLGDFCPG